MKIKILLIEGKRADAPAFLPGLMKKGYQVDCMPNGSAALAYLVDGLPHVVVINAASMRTTGKRICRSIKQNIHGVPIVLVVENATEEAEKLGADIVLELPFTLQKLINRIRPLLPSEQKDVLKVGPFQLNLERRFVRIKGKQVRLTPRLVELLKSLMERPGEVVERKELFCKVWDTEYTDDMRTLDVHISWLRQALGDSPRHPRYIKTVRGTGYRLDV